MAKVYWGLEYTLASNLEAKINSNPQLSTKVRILQEVTFVLTFFPDQHKVFNWSELHFSKVTIF